MMSFIMFFEELGLIAKSRVGHPAMRRVVVRGVECLTSDRNGLAHDVHLILLTRNMHGLTEIYQCAVKLAIRESVEDVAEDTKMEEDDEEDPVSVIKFLKYI